MRDLKPSNLLLDADDKIAVSDFGIAGLVDMTSSSTTTGQQGTPQYMAPEQFDQVGEAPLCLFFLAVPFSVLVKRRSFYPDRLMTIHVWKTLLNGVCFSSHRTWGR